MKNFTAFHLLNIGLRPISKDQISMSAFRGAHYNILPFCFI